MNNQMNFNTKYLTLSLMLLLIVISCRGQTTLRLASVFSDNIVLQQKTDAAIWGKSVPGKAVEVKTSWDEKSYTAKPDLKGNWKVMVTTPSFGGPYQLDISNGEEITLRNVMIGEVWICSGQSNMEMPLAGWGKIKDYQKEIEDAKFPDIRLLQVKQVTSNMPLEDAQIVNGGWQFCSAESVAGFSAVAYFFARELYQKTGIPIGVINTSWGGTIAEAWTSGTTLKTIPDFAAATAKIAATDQAKAAIVYNQAHRIWERNVILKDSGYVAGKYKYVAPGFDATGWKKMTVPRMWEEQGFKGFDGGIWFRKEVDIPAGWAGKTLQLDLGTIDDDDVTYFDGQRVGATAGYTTPRSYSISGDKVAGGKHIITIRIYDGSGGGGFYGDPESVALVNADGERIALAGDWQYKVGIDLKKLPAVPVSADGPNRPTVLYNAMINPFIQFAIRGAIWYQGESNADRADQYRRLFPAMITDWRKQWKIGDFPFYYVQLANFMAVDPQPAASTWAELRDAQSQTLSLPNTGMAVTIDIGEEKDIHPKNKQDVGHRLALIALARNYAQPVVYSGPVLQSFQIDEDRVLLSFKNIEGGLKTKGDDTVKGFAVAGEDQVFHWATASIKGDKVELSSAEVPHPVAVRYAWGNNPVCNLYNGEGLPASPFRTDTWKGITFGKK
jgi:sialate O-acetylesterase